MEVTQAEFARMAGVSRAAVSKKISNRTLIINSAGMLDTDNPVNRSYLDRHQGRVNLVIQQANTAVSSGRPAAEKATTPPKTGAAYMAPAAYPEQSGMPAELLKMTLRELFQKYGSFDGLERYVKVLKDLMTADEKSQRLEEKRMLQIPKDFVIARVFGFLNQLSNKILDAPDTMADQVIALAKAGSDDCRAKVVLYMRDTLSRSIGGAKEAVINELQSLKGKYDDDDRTDIRDVLEELKGE